MYGDQPPPYHVHHFETPAQAQAPPLSAPRLSAPHLNPLPPPAPRLGGPLPAHAFPSQGMLMLFKYIILIVNGIALTGAFILLICFAFVYSNQGNKGHGAPPRDLGFEAGPPFEPDHPSAFRGLSLPLMMGAVVVGSFISFVGFVGAFRESTGLLTAYGLVMMVNAILGVMSRTRNFGFALIFGVCALLLAFYTIVFTTCAFHVSQVWNEPWIFAFSLAMLILSALCVVSSVLLIVGLCGDNKRMIVPWIVSIFITTIVDIALCLYLIRDFAEDINLGLVCFVISDFSVCGINLYAIVCVLSQYQEYAAGRGMAGDRRKQNRKGRSRTMDLPGDCVTLKITENSSISKSTVGGYLALPSPTTTSTSVQ